MELKHQVENLLKEGSYPAEIATCLDITVESVVQCLSMRVGEGALLLSDVYFSWPPDKREILQQAGQGDFPDDRLLSSGGLCRVELELFESLRTRGVFRGDMYEHIANTEIRIHRLVACTLKEEFGKGEAGWWRQGIPRTIRISCVSRREDDDEPNEPYDYTTLIDLSEVIAKKWRIFQAVVPEEYSRDRNPLGKDLRRLNRIRNAVMHPVKARKWTEDDFEFVRRLSRQFEKVAT